MRLKKPDWNAKTLAAVGASSHLPRGFSYPRCRVMFGGSERDAFNCCDAAIGAGGHVTVDTISLSSGSTLHLIVGVARYAEILSLPPVKVDSGRKLLTYRKAV